MGLGQFADLRGGLDKKEAMVFFFGGGGMGGWYPDAHYDKQDSKIDSPNASLYFNKTYLDGRWYIFRNICFVIFSLLSLLCVVLMIVL